MVQDPPSFPLGEDQPRPIEDREVLHHREPRERGEPRGDLPRRPRPGTQEIQDPPAVRVGEGVEDGGERIGVDM